MIKTSLFIGTEDIPELKEVYLFSDTVGRNVERSAKLGFDAVELLVGDPEAFDEKDLKSALAATGMELACINTGRMLLQFGLTLVHEDKKIRDDAFGKFTLLAELCGRFSCPLNIGLYRGRAIDGWPISRSKDLFVDILRDACDYAAQFNVLVNFEPTNRFETNFIQTTDEGLEIIERVDRPNLGLLLDMYHMYIEDDDLYESVVRAGDKIRHVHFSDSDRWPPGVSQGELDFPRLMGLFREVGYDGYLSVGLLRADNVEEHARTTASYLRDLISRR